MDVPASSDVTIESLDATASAAWDAAVAVAPTTPETPAATPAPETATNAAPVVPEAVPPPAEGTNPEPAVEPTPYEKWLAKYDGDRSKADQAIWDTNNRAAELARENAELKAKLETPAGTNPPVVEAAPQATALAPVVEAAPEQIEQWVNQYVAQDQTCLALDQSFRSNRERLNVLLDPKAPDSISAAAREAQKLEAWLQFPEVAADEFQRNGYTAQLTLAQTKHERLQIEAQRLGFENRNLKAEFDGRANGYRSQINDHYTSQRRAAQEQQETNTVITRHATELEKAWTPAITRTVSQFKVPEYEVEDFKADLRTEAMATLEAGIKIEDLDAFMGKSAERLMKRMDRSNREKAAEYGRLATQRAANPAPVPSVVPQVQPSNNSDPIAAIHERENLAWQQLGVAR